MISPGSFKRQNLAAVAQIGFVKLTDRPFDVRTECGSPHSVVLRSRAAMSGRLDRPAFDDNLDVVDPHATIRHIPSPTPLGEMIGNRGFESVKRNPTLTYDIFCRGLSGGLRSSLSKVRALSSAPAESPVGDAASAAPLFSPAPLTTHGLPQVPANTPCGNSPEPRIGSMSVRTARVALKGRGGHFGRGA